MVQESPFVLFFLCRLVFKLRSPSGPVACPSQVLFDLRYTFGLFLQKVGRGSRRGQIILVRSAIVL